MGQLAGRLLRGDMQEAGAQAVGVGLSAMYKQLDGMGFNSGGEFLAAVEEADRLGATVLLGDRDARLTVGRLRDALGQVLTAPEPPGGYPAPPAALAMSLPEASVDFNRETVLSTMAVLKQRENVRLLTAYMRETAPPLYEALIGERDAYMAQSILRAPGRRVVAVVGLAHVDGIEARVLQEAGSVKGRRPQACAAV